LQGEYKSVSEYFGEEIADSDLEKGVQPKAVYYVSDEVQQAQYIAMFKDAGLDAIVCDTYIDPHFISFLEYKNAKKCRFERIDADIDGALKGENSENTDNTQLIETFKKHLVNKDITVKTEAFKTGKIPAVVNVDEFMRRMSEMNGFYGMEEMDVSKHATLVLNTANPVVQSLAKQTEDKQKFVVEQIYYLAMLSFKQLQPQELSSFVENNSQLLLEYCK
jgi:molecular chaperone HtpG